MKPIKSTKTIASIIQRIREQVESLEIPKDFAQKLAKLADVNTGENKQVLFLSDIEKLEKIIGALKEAAGKKHRTKIKEFSEKELQELQPAKEALRKLEMLLQSDDFGVQCDRELLEVEETFLNERKKFRDAKYIREIYKDSIFSSGVKDEKAS